MKRIVNGLLTLCVAAMLAAPMTAFAQMSIGNSVRFAPPPIPVYQQPVCPGAGYIWTPGYWAWGPYGYYWVPGTWVLAPAVGLFWTPGYWAWNAGLYLWHAGYWGPTVGFYGGINYGYGYPGYGYFGGRWRHGVFFYNRAVTNINVTYIHSTYDQPANNPGPSLIRVSYNGGAGGIRARATAAQLAYAHGPHVSPTAMQLRQRRTALDDPAQRFTVNRGRPQFAASARPGEFHGMRVRAEKNGYLKHKARLPAPGYRGAVRVAGEPRMRIGGPYANSHRQPVRPEMNSFRTPAALPMHSMPAAARRAKIHQPQRLLRIGDSGQNLNRVETHPMARFHGIPMRRTLPSAPRAHAPVLLGDSRRHGRSGLHRLRLPR